MPTNPVDKPVENFVHDFRAYCDSFSTQRLAAEALGTSSKNVSTYYTANLRSLPGYDFMARFAAALGYETLDGYLSKIGAIPPREDGKVFNPLSICLGGIPSMDQSELGQLLQAIGRRMTTLQDSC